MSNVRWRLLGCVLAGALVASACSSSGDEESIELNSGSQPVASEADSRVINIGWAAPDVGAFALLNDDFDIGDPEEQANAVIQRWESEGLLPEGIEINLKVRSFDVLNIDQKRAACTGFAKDDDVLAVLGGIHFVEGSTCLAEQGVPVISQEGGSASDYTRLPYFFSIRPSESQVLEAFAEWGDQNGIFANRKIGVFWDLRAEEALNDFRAALQDLDIELTVDLGSNGEGVGSPQDTLAVERFLDEGVDTAIMLVGASSVTNFMAYADDQRYKPDYLAMEWAGQIVDVSSAALNQQQFDGTQAMAASRVGEIAAGLELNPAARLCLDTYADFTGQRIEEVSPETAEYAQLLQTCDLFSLLLEALENMDGVDLTREGFVEALETINEFELAYWGDVTYTTDRHGGIGEFRTVEWRTECGCWTALDEFAPFG